MNILYIILGTVVELIAILHIVYEHSHFKTTIAFLAGYASMWLLTHGSKLLMDNKWLFALIWFITVICLYLIVHYIWRKQQIKKSLFGYLIAWDDFARRWKRRQKIKRFFMPKKQKRNANLMAECHKLEEQGGEYHNESN